MSPGCDGRHVLTLLHLVARYQTSMLRALKEVHSATHPARLQRASRDEAQDDAVLHRPLWRVRQKATDAAVDDDVQSMNQGVALLRNAT